MRVPVLVLALLAMPIAAGVAQGRGKQQRVRSTSLESDCKQEHADALSRAVADGHAPYGLDKKCSDPAPPVPPPPPPPPAPVPPPPPPPPVPPPPPPPPPAAPPTGVHRAVGVVYEDIAEMDGHGNGRFDPMAGEMGLEGWTVQLYWNGQLVTEATTDANGAFVFPNLGNGTLWSACVIEQAGFVRTQPVPGTACGGPGYAFVLSSSFQTDAENPFGMQMLIP